MLVADSEPIFRLGALTILDQAGFRAEPFPGQVELVPAMLALAAREFPPRALILDARLGSGSYAQDTIAALCSAIPELAVVLVVDRLGPPGLVGAMEVGARALLSRLSTPEELFAALRAALVGTNWVSGDLAGLVRAELLAEASGDRVDELTPRERMVLDGLAEGRTNAIIGQHLGISEHTVRNHVHAVLRKLGAANRTDAVAVAVRRGLIDI